MENKNLSDVYIVDAIRTGVGKFCGSLSSIPAVKLGETVIKSLLDRNKLDSKAVNEVIMGQVLTGGCGQNPARQASIAAGISIEVPAYTVNMVCGSGLKSVALGMEAIMVGNSQLVIAGGQESMSTANHAINLRQGTKIGDAQLIDMMMKDGLSDAFNFYPMGNTAENLAKKYNITRAEQDEFAYNSQVKAAAAQNANKFRDEIVELVIKDKKGETIFNQDESIRADTNMESLTRLKPVFLNDGTVTAGNSSGINDGAGAVLLASGKMIEEKKYSPLAKIIAYASFGVEPEYMGIGPVFAVKEALKRANWRIEDLDLIEANEAFAAQSIAVNKELGWDLSKVNVNGGAIAIGHPIGASGTRVLVSLLHEMKKRNAKKALATLCIGGGMGIAMCIENI